MNEQDVNRAFREITATQLKAWQRIVAAVIVVLVVAVVVGLLPLAVVRIWSAVLA